MIGDDYYTTNRTKEGGLAYFDEKGKQYTGDIDGFARSVMDAMNSINGIDNKEVQSRLNGVLSSEKVITIEYGPNEFTDGILTWAPDQNGIDLTNGGTYEKKGVTSKERRDADLELVHELLGHGFQYVKGLITDERIDRPVLSKDHNIIG